MATRARFGRLPRSAPSLTATIVALGQEYQRVRENNILRAWKEGGLFEGKKVTDEMVLKWLTDRRNGVSRDDPMWDYYNNMLGEYQFSIANSKMELAYARHKVGDKGMVAFYHKWAGKLPVNSEAYRAREKLAAAYADRAVAKGRGSSQAASDRRYLKSINDNYKNEFAYDTVTFFLVTEARKRGILMENEDLSNVDPSQADGARIDALWDEIATSADFADEREFYSKQIEKVTGKPFGGDFSKDAYAGYTRRKKANVTDRIGKARKAGKQDDVKNFKQDKAQVRAVDVQTAGFDETVTYEESRAAWEEIVTDPNAQPLAIDRANKEYIADLEKIRDGLDAKTGVGEEDERIGWINNELETMHGNENPLEHWGGKAGIDLPNVGGAGATETAKGINRLNNVLDLLDDRDPVTGEPLFVLTKITEGPGGSVPVNTSVTNHAQIKWDAVPKGMMDPDAIYVVTADEGDPRAGKIITGISPTPVFITSEVTVENDDGTTTTKDKQADKPSAYMYTLPDGGSIGYKYQDRDGKWLFTPVNPFGKQVINPQTGEVDYEDTEITVTTKEATIKVQGDGIRVAGDSAAMKPELYNPEQNSAMPGTVVKSGYSLMLLATNPKNHLAYTLNPDDIFAALKTEAGNDTALLEEKIIDADHQRNIYLGNSTIEQQRIRTAAITGAPLPVPLSAVMVREGITAPGEEQAALFAITGKSKDDLIEDWREVNRSFLPNVEAAENSTIRKYDFVPPVQPIGGYNVGPPTALGAGFGAAVSSTLGNLLTAATGSAQASITPPPPAVGPSNAGVPTVKPSGPIGGYNTGSPTGPPSATAPTAPTPFVTPQATTGKTTTPTPLNPYPVQNYSTTPTNPRYGGLGPS